MWHTPWILLISAFFIRNEQFSLYFKIQTKLTFWYIFSNSFDFYWVFIGFCNQRDYNFDDVSKIGYSRSGLLEINVHWNKVYDVIISAHDVTNKILSCDSNYIVDAVLQQSFVTLAFPQEKLSYLHFYKDLIRKNNFFEGWSWLKFNNLGLALGQGWRICLCRIRMYKELLLRTHTYTKYCLCIYAGQKVNNIIFVCSMLPHHFFTNILGYHSALSKKKVFVTNFRCATRGGGGLHLLDFSLWSLFSWLFDKMFIEVP